MKSHLEKNGTASLVGHTIDNSHDLAILGQIHRDPRMEKFHIIYTKDNKVVGHNTLSSRLPGIVQAFDHDSEAGFEKIRSDMQNHGADGYHLMHNHPSGSSTPSISDGHLTREFDKKVPGFKSHVVIDNTEYSTIHPSGDITTHSVDPHTPYHLYKDPKTLPHDSLAEHISGPDGVFRVGKMFEHLSNATLIASNGSTGKVNAVAHYPSHLLSGDDPQTHNRIRNFLRHSGSSRGFIVAPHDGNILDYKHHVDAGRILDVADHNGTSVQTLGLSGGADTSSLGARIKSYGSLTKD